MCVSALGQVLPATLLHLKLEKHTNLGLPEQRKREENLCLGWAGILEGFPGEGAFELCLEGRSEQQHQTLLELLMCLPLLRAPVHFPHICFFPSV